MVGRSARRVEVLLADSRGAVSLSRVRQRIVGELTGPGRSVAAGVSPELAHAWSYLHE